MIRWILTAFCLIIPIAPAAAQDWQPITEALIVAEKPGFGKLCGVVVDHATGDVTINLSDKGLYRSTDAAKTWQKLGTPFKGRTETPGCMMLDPTGGKRLVAALVYGSSILVSPDRGESWKPLDKKSTHVDWCAVDWSDPDLKWIYTLKHESGDLLLVSRDGGKSFAEVGKGYGPAWIFDNKTAVVAQAKSKNNPKPGYLAPPTAARRFSLRASILPRALPRWAARTRSTGSSMGALHQDDRSRQILDQNQRPQGRHLRPDLRQRRSAPFCPMAKRHPRKHQRRHILAKSHPCRQGHEKRRQSLSNT